MKNSPAKNKKIWLLRMAAIFLMLWSLHQTWVGYAFYQGRYQFEMENDSKALDWFKQVNASGIFHLRTEALQGQIAWEEMLRTQNPKSIETLKDQFARLTEKAPYFSKGWLYLGMVELFQHHITHSGQKMSDEEWELIKPLFLTALEKEPGSAWLAYMVGVNFLAEPVSTKDEDKAFAVSQLRKAIEIVRKPSTDYPYLPKPSIYLRPALELLWNRFHDLSLLLSIVPESAPSYAVLIDVMTQYEIDQHYSEVFARVLELRKTAYDEACARGQDLLNQNKYEKAFAHFRKAYWIMGERSNWAKAGILIALHRSRMDWKDSQNPLSGIKIQDVLKEVLKRDAFVGALDSKLHDLAKSLGVNPKESIEIEEEGIDEPSQTQRFEGAFDNAYRGGLSIARKNLIEIPVQLNDQMTALELFAKIQNLKAEEVRFIEIAMDSNLIGRMSIYGEQWKRIRLPLEGLKGRHVLQIYPVRKGHQAGAEWDRWFIEGVVKFQTQK